MVARSTIPQKLNTYLAGLAQQHKRRRYSRVKTRVIKISSQTKTRHSSNVKWYCVPTPDSMKITITLSKANSAHIPSKRRPERVFKSNNLRKSARRTEETKPGTDTSPKKGLTFVSPRNYSGSTFRQETACRKLPSRTGRVFAHSGPAIGQRVRNTQPEGGLIGDGNSPSSNWITLFLS